MTLKIQAGDFEQGFGQVILEVQTPPDNGRGNPTRLIFPLPSAPDLPVLYHQWQLQYRHLTRGRRGSFKNVQATHLSVAECQQCSQTLRERLNQWLQPLQQALNLTLSPQDEVYFWIHAHQNLTDSTKDLLYRLPWHFWEVFPEHCPVEVILSLNEQTEPVGKVKRSKNIPKVRILGILGSSEGIDLNEDEREISQLLGANPLFLKEPERSQFEKLWEKSWDILFYGGHSETQGDGQTGLLWINDNDPLDLQDIRRTLKIAINKGLRLAIFNSCDGLGLAKQLADLELPYIIVWREPVPDKVAQEFLKSFLQSFASGKSLVVSIWEARVKLQELEQLEKQLPGITGLPAICQHPAAAPLIWNDLRYGDRDKYLFRTALVASVVTTALVMGVRSLGLLQGWELPAYDLLMRSRPDEGQDNRILVVTIDDKDIEYQDEKKMERKGSLSDAALSQLLTVLEPYHPAVIGLDIYRDFKVNIDQTQLPTQLKNPNFFGVCKGSATDSSGIKPPPEVPKEQVGFSDLTLDDDDVLRRYLYYAELENNSPCKANAHLSFELAFHYLERQGKPIKVKASSEDCFQIDNVLLKPLAFPSGGYQQRELSKNPGCQMLLNYRTRGDVARSISLRNILSGKFNSDWIKDRIILIGVTQKGDDPDVASTPFNQEMYGVFIQAQMASQILSTVLDGRPLLSMWSLRTEVLWVWGWALVGGLLAWRLWRLSFLVLADGIVIIILGSACLVLFLQGWWVPLVPPLLAIVTTSGVVWLTRLRILPKYN